VIVEDIATDPLWGGTIATWLCPIVCAPVGPHRFSSSQGNVDCDVRNVLSRAAPTDPSAIKRSLTRSRTYLVAAIQQKLAQERLQRSEAYLAQAQKLTRTGSWAWDPRTDKVALLL